MSSNKTIPSEASVQRFIQAVEPERKRRDCEAIVAMMEAASGAPPKMWGTSIVGFGSYHYRYQSGREGDWMLCGFAPRKQNLVLYIMPGFSNYDQLLEKLGKHKTGKSCLYINKLADIDMNVLEQLVAESVADMRSRYETTE